MTFNAVQDIVAWNMAADNIPDNPVLDDDEFFEIVRRDMIILQEEMDELTTAWRNRDRQEVIDALADIAVVDIGAIAKTGYNPEDMLNEVQISNWSKMVNGKLQKNPMDHPTKPNKIIKGPDYRRPDLGRVMLNNEILGHNMHEDANVYVMENK